MCTSCWLRGGYITHHCGGLFICCERFAEPLSAQARNIENGWTINFGPNSVFGGGGLGDSRYLNHSMYRVTQKNSKNLLVILPGQ